MRLGSVSLIPGPKSRICHGEKYPGPSPPKKFRRISSAAKVMASILWDSQGVIMADYLEKRRTINSTYYAEELRRLSQEIVKKRRRKLTRGVLLLQYNIPAHTSQVAMVAGTKSSVEILLLIPVFFRFSPFGPLCFQV